MVAIFLRIREGALANALQPRALCGFHKTARRTWATKTLGAQLISAQSNPNATRTLHLSGGDPGTVQTIAQIRRLVDRSIKSIHVNRLACSIVWATPQFSESAKAQAVFSWVQQNTRFISDIVGKETLRTADEILRVRAGDCDDLNAILIPSLLGTIGIRSRLVTIAHDPDDPQDFSHIYSEAFVDGEWVPMDVARPGATYGRGPENYFRMRVWDLYSPAYFDAKTLNGYLSRGKLGAPRRRLRGMGQGFDVSQFEAEIPSIINSTTGLVSAARANPSNIVPAPIGGMGVAAPAGYTYNAQGQLVSSATLTTSGISSTTLLLFGGLAVLLLVMRR